MMVAIFKLYLSQPFWLHILSEDNWSNEHNSAIELPWGAQGDAIGVYLSQPFRLFMKLLIGEAFDGGKSPNGSDRNSLRHSRRIGSCASIIMSLKGSDIFHHSSNPH